MYDFYKQDQRNSLVFHKLYSKNMLRIKLNVTTSPDEKLPVNREL